MARIYNIGLFFLTVYVYTCNCSGDIVEEMASPVIDSTYLLLKEIRDIKTEISLDKEEDTQLKVSTTHILESLSSMIRQKEEIKSENNECCDSLKGLLTQINEIVQRQEVTLEILRQTSEQQDQTLQEHTLLLEEMAHKGKGSCVKGGDTNSKNVESMVLKKTIPIPNPEEYHWYKFSDSGEYENIVLHSVYGNDIRVIDTFSDSIQSKYSAQLSSLSSMCTPGTDKHLAIEVWSKKLKMLDEDFKLINTYISEKMMVDVSYLGQNRFLVCDGTTSAPHQIRFQTMVIENQSFRKESDITIDMGDDAPSHMAVNADDDIVFLSTRYDIFIVDLKDNSYTRHDVSQYLNQDISSIYFASETILIGENSHCGNIHQFDVSGQFLRTLPNVRFNGAVYSMTIRNRKFYVASKHEIYIYE